MSTRYNDGSHYENHQRAAELHDGAPHAHRVGEQHGKDDHISGHEHSRLALEHSRDAHEHSNATTVGHGIAAFGHDDIAALAHELWQSRGCPHGSSEEDWFRAAEELRSGAGALKGPLRSDDEVKSIGSKTTAANGVADKVMSVKPTSQP